MSTSATHRASHLRAADGGMPARRAIATWSWRMARRQGRQHLLIVVMIAIVVAATVMIGAAAFNLAPAEGRRQFGDASDTLVLDDLDPALLDTTIAAAEAFGEVDPIGHRPVPLPGSIEPIDYRSQAVDGPYGAPLIDIVEGRAPERAGEVAISDGIASTLNLAIGDVIDLDDVGRNIVGIVENPTDLDDEFVALPPIELASSASVLLLVRGDADDFRRYDPPGNGPRIVNSRSDVPEGVMAAVLMLIASTVLMLLVALVAAASFAVIAQRRLPQLGMLSAVGATERHVRLVMLADGALVGVVAAVLGGCAGLCGWFVAEPPMETLIGARIDPLDVPWWLVAAAMVMAVAAATMAAWWPARTIARIPTVSALSGRVPRPTSTQRTAVGALVASALGVVALRVGSDFGRTGPSVTRQAALVTGVLALTAALLLASPVLVRRLGRIAGATPISCRLALRDLARYQSRSAAGLAAVGLAMGIAAVIIVSTAAAEAGSGIANLAQGQIVTRSDEHDVMLELPDTEELAAIEAGVAEIIASIDAMVATPLRVVRDPASDPDGPVADPTLDVVRRVEPHWEHIANVYAATPEVLAALDIAPEAVAGDDVVTAADGELYLFGTPGDAIPERRQGRRLDTTGTLTPTYSALPAALVSPSVIDARQWETADAGRWLIGRDEPLTDSELRVARSIAARHGFVIESYDPGDDWTTARLATGLVGMLLALGVLAATVGLMRADAAGEARTLTAAGATRAARRGVTAMTAGSLAALGGLLGIAVAYLGVAAGRIDDLQPVPWAALAVLGAGTPLVAAGAGWLLSGGEPPSVARRPID